MTNTQLHTEWIKPLSSEFEAAYMNDLVKFLIHEKNRGNTIYPATHNVFAALNKTPLSSVKVVILGQDPYHGPNQAQGLSFSVPKGEKIPPSLRNIYKELTTDLGLVMPVHGNLESWATQGVLLLNSVLTVEDGKAASHQGKGWEMFTDAVIELISRSRELVVFLLWGAYGQKKGAVIDRQRHCVLAAPHPSPLSAHRGFLGCQHFSKANQYLVEQDKSPIDWCIS
jgi:uracil-DNA glycosylase